MTNIHCEILWFRKTMSLRMLAPVLTIDENYVKKRLFAIKVHELPERYRRPTC